ncbi:hypothetical protein [Bosea sp. (in: a-proteobacteria)]|uniref:hypothetical protein n=1 Tax=Bosea sp. (in: a-proteobacteria) TaxID=1871050 RepID=UPI002634A09C|nr:hypothetical protein [Bosea sp. (in: a-proteobacteria)]MCO5092437.1 hypothetical protein [Bosea sp. (in: a-proteobacteria)]
MVRVLSSSRIIAASSLATALLFAASAAEAGGCRGSACYNLVTTPPVFGTVDETYQVRPAQVQRRVIPAEYETVTDTVMIAPERRIPHHRAAVYETVTEKVMIAAAGRRWEVTRDARGNMVGCWVDVPARYGFQSRRVEVSPASIDYETVPAVYTQRQRQVMVRPTQVVREEIPAVYETRQRQVMVSPGSQHWAPARR